MNNELQEKQDALKKSNFEFQTFQRDLLSIIATNASVDIDVEYFDASISIENINIRNKNTNLANSLTLAFLDIDDKNRDNMIILKTEFQNTSYSVPFKEFMEKSSQLAELEEFYKKEENQEFIKQLSKNYKMMQKNVDILSDEVYKIRREIRLAEAEK